MSPTPPRDQVPQRIAVLPGDGIGPEVTRQATKVLDCVTDRWSLDLELVEFPWSADHFLETGVSLPEGALEDLRHNFAAILVGAYGDPRVPDMRHAADILLGIRFGLDLYINFRPICLYDDRLCPLKDKTARDIDFVVFRENTEGAYVGVGGTFKEGTRDEIAVQEEIHTRKGVERIIRAAFDFAVRSGRSQVCMADKSNVMQFGHGLWQRVFNEVAGEFAQIQASHMFVDALAMQLIRKPQEFDVIVTNNMFGDIITDLGAALQGGLGMAGSANLHPGRVSMFEPVHGSAPKYAGAGTANPMAAILTAALLLEDLGHHEAAREVEEAIRRALADGVKTRDLGGDRSTDEVGDFVVRAVRQEAAAAS